MDVMALYGPIVNWHSIYKCVAEHASQQFDKLHKNKADHQEKGAQDFKVNTIVRYISSFVQSANSIATKHNH